MKLLKFKDFHINEGAKRRPKNVELKNKVLDHITEELKKQKMNRADMIKNIKSEFKNESDIDKISMEVVDDVTHDPLFTKLKVKIEIFTKGGNDYSYYFIGDDAEDPKNAIKKEIKITTDNRNIKNFDQFGEEKKSKRGEALRKWREEQKKKKLDKNNNE